MKGGMNFDSELPSERWILTPSWWKTAVTRPSSPRKSTIIPESSDHDGSSTDWFDALNSGVIIQVRSSLNTPNTGAARTRATHKLPGHAN
eukprot:3548024-Rhodomonas_salina.1